MNMEQGLYLDCFYCQDLFPETEGNCKKCQNKKSYFQPAQMMDKETSEQFVLESLLNFLINGNRCHDDLIIRVV